jgi:hypothetical protein
MESLSGRRMDLPQHRNDGTPAQLRSGKKHHETRRAGEV